MGLYADWNCQAVAKERAALERARDARADFRIPYSESQARFEAAYAVFNTALISHRALTACTDNH